MSHFLLMSLYALIVSVFFATLSRRQFNEQVKLFLQLFLGLVGGGLLVAWLMVPFPDGPPTPFPPPAVGAALLMGTVSGARRETGT